MRLRRFAFTATVLIAASVSVFALDGDSEKDTGDAAIAARYASWAVKAAEEGRWEEAEGTLERAADFSDASSDLSYLLALARLKLDRPARSALAAVRRSLEADRWDRYGREAAFLVEAAILVRLRLFDEALAALKQVSAGPERAYLKALALVDDYLMFRLALREALDAYPDDPRFVRLIFDQAYARLPNEWDRSLMDFALVRLPFLLKLDPSLAYRASPFIRDLEERRRLVASYRASTGADLASLPQALELGLVDEAVATAELFSADSIDVAVFRAVWALLRDDTHRAAFEAAAVAYQGELTEDIDRDGYAETSVRYRGGEMVSSSFDADQDGLPEIELEYEDGLPARARVAMAADTSQAQSKIVLSMDASEELRIPRLPATIASADERKLAVAEWSRYPSVARVSYDGTQYIAAPATFPYAPVRLVPLVEGRKTLSLRFPKNDQFVSRLTFRSLVFFAVAVVRPGTFTEGSVERVELVRGVPRRATETVDGRVVSVLEFSAGRPSFRKTDVDQDGRMETIRRFRTTDAPAALDWEESIESIESDWDGDGIAEYAEHHFKNGSIERSWDMDGDGKRERKERSTTGGANAIR